MASMSVVRTADPDEAVRQVLVTRAVTGLRLALWILGDESSAEDAVQEAALVAWSRRKGLRNSDSADAWFTRILVNVCRSELRRRRRPLALPVVREILDPWQSEETDEELNLAIARLTENEQIVLALRYGKDMTVPMIAETIGLPEGTVKSRLHFALRNLRAALDAQRRAQGGSNGS